MLRLTNRCHSLDRERYLVSSYVLGFATPLLYRVMGSHLSPIAKQLKLEGALTLRWSCKSLPGCPPSASITSFAVTFGLKQGYPKGGFFIIVNPQQKAPTHKYI